MCLATSPHPELLTIAFEEPVEGGLLASPAELLSLVYQSLLHRLVSTQHHDAPGSQVDREHRAIALTDLMEVGGLKAAAPTGSWPVPSPHLLHAFPPGSGTQGAGHPKICSFLSGTLQPNPQISTVLRLWSNLAHPLPLRPSSIRPAPSPTPLHPSRVLTPS